MIHIQDRPGYQKPIYYQGMTPPFAPEPEVKPARWQKPIARPAKPTTPYDNAYTRDLDGALMIELPGWGTFVSEQWAVSNGYITPAQSQEAKAARQEARKERKAGQKQEKQAAYARKKQRIQKARQKEMLA